MSIIRILNELFYVIIIICGINCSGILSLNTSNTISSCQNAEFTCNELLQTLKNSWNSSNIDGITQWAWYSIFWVKVSFYPGTVEELNSLTLVNYTTNSSNSSNTNGSDIMLTLRFAELKFLFDAKATIMLSNIANFVVKIFTRDPEILLTLNCNTQTNLLQLQDLKLINNGRIQFDLIGIEGHEDKINKYLDDITAKVAEQFTITLKNLTMNSITLFNEGLRNSTTT